MTDRIYGFAGQHAFLSNFFVESDGLTGEHRFQAAKTSDPTWVRRILDAPTPSKAKYHGRSCTLRQDWEAVKIDAMRQVVSVKFTGEPLRTQLIATGDAELIEANVWNDRFWGVDKASGVGENFLGRLLMEARTALVSAATA